MYTQLVAEVIPIKEIIEKVEQDYTGTTEQMARDLAGFSGKIHLQINAIDDIQARIIQPMKTVYEEYKRKIGFIKRIRSLADQVATSGTRDLVPGDVDTVIARLDDNSSIGPQYDQTDDDDPTLDLVPRDRRDGRHTMLGVYRLYIYGYFFLYEIHRLYIHFGNHIKDKYLPLITNVLLYVNNNGFTLNDFETEMRIFQQQLEESRREAATLQENINQLQHERDSARPEDIEALNRAIQEKQDQLESARRAQAAAMGSSDSYKVRADQLQQYLKTISGITLDSLENTVKDDIMTSLRTLTHRGGAGASNTLLNFIGEAKTRLEASVQTSLIDPARRFFDQCVAEFSARITEYNVFKARIQRFYDQLQIALAAVQERDGLDLERKRTERDALEEERRRAVAERERLERERNDLDAQIDATRRNVSRGTATGAVLEAKLRDLKKRFERLEADLVDTRLSASIENAKTTADLVGVR